MAEGLGWQADAGFVTWLAGSGGSLLISTYQAGHLIFVNSDGQRLRFLLRKVMRPMGIDVVGGRLAVASKGRLQLYDNAPALAPLVGRSAPHDALWLPSKGWEAEGLDLHDVALGEGGELWAVNTKGSSLVTAGEGGRLFNRWQPPFVSAYTLEDRCHLNGLALREGRPAVVTALAETDVPAGWREHKVGGGVLVDVQSGDVILRGLTMPHSPRIHNGALYVLDSGQGRLLRVGGLHVDRVCQLQGYLRGLAFCGNVALIGLCRIRESNTFGGMPVQARHPDGLLCGVALVDVVSGQQLGLLRFTSGVHEIFDLRHLAGLQRPNLYTLEAWSAQRQQELRRAA
jgi:uncharacterized protein (TIGR03032 family)